MKDFVLERLEQALEDYALDLAQKAAKGELSAAEANHLRGLFRDAVGLWLSAALLPKRATLSSKLCLTLISKHYSISSSIVSGRTQ